MNDQKILDNAPDWADTHRKMLDYPDCTTYVDNKYEDKLDRSLADIKELVELRKANAELKKELKVTPKLQCVLDFLLGIGDIEGYDFSEGPEDQGPYWWRAHLREALKAGS
jgi:hypothetical protein